MTTHLVFCGMSTFTTPDTFLTVGRAKREQAKSALKTRCDKFPRDAVQTLSGCSSKWLANVHSAHPVPSKMKKIEKMLKY